MRLTYLFIPSLVIRNTMGKAHLKIAISTNESMWKNARGNCESVVGIVTGLWAWWLGFESWQGPRFSVKCPNKLWDPPRLLFSRYWGHFCKVSIRQGVKVDDHCLPCSAMLRMRGAIFLFASYASMAWTGTTLFLLCFIIVTVHCVKSVTLQYSHALLNDRDTFWKMCC